MKWSCHQVAFECVSLTFHPFGIVLAAGSSEGHLIIINTETGVLVNTVRVCGSPLTCVGYNPCKITIISKIFGKYKLLYYFRSW